MHEILAYIRRGKAQAEAAGDTEAFRDWSDAEFDEIVVIALREGFTVLDD